MTTPPSTPPKRTRKPRAVPPAQAATPPAAVATPPAATTPPAAAQPTRRRSAKAAPVATPPAAATPAPAATPATPPAAATPAPAAKPTRRRSPKASPAAVPPNVQPAAPAAAQPTPAAGLRLFQVHPHAPDLAQLDPELEPLQLDLGDNPYPEVASHRLVQRDPTVRQCALWGVLAADFATATGLDGAALKAILASQPGYDAYFCNPSPEHEAAYHNPWLQGAALYPDFATLSREFLNAAGLGAELVEALTPSRLFGTSQCLVATPAFWDAYLAFVQSTLSAADRKLNKTARAMLNMRPVAPAGASPAPSYLHLVLERLFSVFLMMPDSARFKACKYPLPAREQALDVHLRLLREMKDLALAQNSFWEAACWANYRTLYLMQVHPRDWLQKNLAMLTPTTLRFGLPVVDIHYPFVPSHQALSAPPAAVQEA